MRSLLAIEKTLSPDALELQSVLRARGMGEIADELLLAKAEPGLLGMKLTGVPSIDHPDLAALYPVGHDYASGKVINLGSTPLGAAANSQADLVTAGFATLSLIWRIGNASTPATGAGDASGIILPYEDDDVTLLATQLAQDFQTRASVLAGSASVMGQRFILGGLSKVAVRLTNQNVGALQGATAIYWLQK